MNENCRGLGTSVVRLRFLAAGLALLVAGCVVLGLGSRSLPTAAKAVDQFSPQPTLAASLAPTERVAGFAARARTLFAGLPLMFEPNQGQANLDPADPHARFLARGSGYSLLLGSEGATLRLYSHARSTHDLSKNSSSSVRVESLEMKLAGANPAASLTGTDLLPGKSNYLLGNDPAKWRRGVPQFARVRFEQIYPGINLVFYGNQGHLEYDFQVAPGADPAQVEVEFDGAQPLQLNDGALVIPCAGARGEGASVRLEAPRVYQEIAGREQPVEARFVLRNAHRAGFAIGAYDRSRELVIDPVLSFATYFGGTGNELNTSVAVDGSQNIYLAGSTNSPNLATAGVLQTSLAGAQNVYIAKITPPLGSTPAVLDYVTYLGGTGTDYPVGIQVDAAGNAYVAGTTTSPKFPTTETAYQTVPEVPGTHVFVSVLNPSASALTYSTYLSGNNTDIASGMTIDAKQNVYVTGTTQSTPPSVSSVSDQFPASTLPEQQAYQFYPRAAIQFFLTEVSTTATGIGSIPYSTYFGGGAFYTPTPIAIGGGVAVDVNQNVYFTGTTNFVYTGTSSTTDFPILNAYQPCLDQPPPTVIVGAQTCLNTSTTSNSDAFVAKLNLNASAAQGEQLQWSTYLGGTGSDFGNGVALDPTGAANVYVTGTTNSPDFVGSSTLSQIASFQKCLNNVTPTPIPSSGCAAQLTTPPLNDAYVARLSNPTNSTTGTPTNVSLTYFSYLGGQNNDEGLAITVDYANGALITGWTQSPTLQTLASPTPPAGSFPVFPYPSPIQSQLNGTQDAFIARLNTAASITGQTTTGSWTTYYGGSTPNTGTGAQALGQGTGIALDTNQNLYVAGSTNAIDLQLAKPLQAQNNGGYDAFVTQVATAASLSITGVLTLGPNQTYISAGNQATFTYTLTNNGPDLATGITVTDNIGPAITGISLGYVSGSAVPGGDCSFASTSSIVTCSIPSLQAGSTATITITLTPAASGSGSQAEFNGGALQATALNAINTATTSVPAQMSDFTLSVSPVNVAVPTAGDTAVYQVQLIPHPVYGSGISLSVSIPAGLTGTTQSFTTSPVTLQGTSGATTTLNVTTTARPITTTSLWKRPFYAVWFAVPGLALLGLGGDRRRRRIAGVLLLSLVFALILLQPACSKTSTPPPVSGTQAGTYTLTIAATSGSDTKNASIVLTVP